MSQSWAERSNCAVRYRHKQASRDRETEDTPEQTHQPDVQAHVAVNNMTGLMSDDAPQFIAFEEVKGASRHGDGASLGSWPVKFRSMRVDRSDNASKQATAGDPRIYPMGKLLRKTGIDEIPQFLSVLVGHMSLVGPRPHMIVHTRRFQAIMNEYHIRTFAKPGISGLAQLSGFRDEATSDEEVKERTKLDIKYIENWSLPLDFWIILKTVLQSVKPAKRHADLESVMPRGEGESF